jgi:site-specific DNA recombinase
VRVATYTRISTDEENQPYSLGAQDDRLLAYIRSQEGLGACSQVHRPDDG